MPAKKLALLVLSPTCAAFSQLHTLSADKRCQLEPGEQLRKARVHLKFCMELVEGRMSEGTGFLFDKPLTAGTWNEERTASTATCVALGSEYRTPGAMECKATGQT